MTSSAVPSVLPTMIKKLVVNKKTSNFREAIELVSVPIPVPGPEQVLVKTRFMGINASDINYTAGRYDFAAQPPFDCGFEGIGEVVSLGPHCAHTAVGQPVAYMKFGCFAEYVVLDENRLIPLPAVKPQYLPLLVSGLTAAISLDKVGQLQPNETILITSAAGGTGQFAVQWAKNTGCHVIGVCSSPEKVEFLKSLGCDRPINYTKENLAEVLKKEYPKGVDVVYECIGGEVFETCLGALADKGRLLIIGFITGYEGEKGGSPVKLPTSALIAQLLVHSQSLRGFMLRNYAADQPQYIMRLIKMFEDGKISSAVDMGQNSASGVHFYGIEAILPAVEHMYARKNIGKIVVECG